MTPVQKVKGLRQKPTVVKKQVQKAQRAQYVYHAQPTVKEVGTPLTETTQLYLVNIGSPNVRGSSSLATFWSLFLIDNLRPDKATLHSLSVTATPESPIHRLRTSFLYNGAEPSVTCDVQIVLPPPMEINLAKYDGMVNAKDRATEDSASALLEELIRRGLPLATLLPPPPADSFDAFDSDFDFKRGIPSPDCVLLSYCHIGTYSQTPRSPKSAQHGIRAGSELTFESFRQSLSNAMGHVLNRSSNYSCVGRVKYDVQDLELRSTHDWAVRAISGVHGSFKLSSDMPSFRDGTATLASVKEHIEKVLDAQRVEERRVEGVAMTITPI
ncbi:hypothetical protein EST38_g8991 [Candolleomyces aberdarensis]|uniref:Uncharacterized protein n=1 Tax=Candolleomyces aberdarensis TaxID=2316362 RepID=A0A4Q2DBV7_9AGAR|nr:hypothetical protein EST38_g8991 [Candolleomyces aberdarensis]